MALVIMGHGARAALFERQAGLGSVERLDLALFVDAEHDGVRRRIDIKPHHVAQLVSDSGSLESLKSRTRCGWSSCARQMRCTELTETPTALAIIAPVQCVVSPGGSCRVKATTRSATSWPSRRMQEGRVLSRKRPSKPPA